MNDTGDAEWIMVHLDICGTVYDDTALVSSTNGVDVGDDGPELLVPLKVFCTPEYEMNLIPNTDTLILTPLIFHHVFYATLYCDFIL